MREVIGFASGPQRIAATICVRDQQAGRGPCAGAVFVHGRDSDRRGFVEYGERVAEELGITCLALDLSGHGDSTGTRGDVSPAQNLEDVLTACDELAARASVDPGRIALCGTSYGACLASRAVHYREASGLLLHAPTIVADDDMARPLRLRSPRRDPASAPQLFGGLGRYARHALVVESENDEWIRRQVIEAYLNALPMTAHEVIAGASHELSRPEWRQLFLGLVLRFLADL